jgi:GNAT superfamily N-acetyltransferase
VTDGFVRTARAHDAGDLARVQVACWQHGYADLLPDAVLAKLTSDEALGVWEGRWLEAITNPPTSRHKVLVGVADAASPTDPGMRVVVAFASAGPAGDADRWPGTDAELFELRVRPERTGRGHGGRLLHAVVDTLVEDGFRTASTWALEADAALRRFLETAGWAADGARAELDVGVTLPAIRLHTRIGEGI